NGVAKAHRLPMNFIAGRPIGSAADGSRRPLNLPSRRGTVAPDRTDDARRLACDPAVRQVFWQRTDDGAHCSRSLPIVNQPAKPASDSATRPTTNENYLLISAFAAAAQAPLVAISKRIADAGCNLAEARVSALGAELSVIALAQGSWDAIAKLENALARFERDGDMRLSHFRTGPKPMQPELLPYVVEVVAA